METKETLVVMDTTLGKIKFKLYNDTYGHNAGDMALDTIVKTVNRCTRRTDRLIRLGGDEFLLVLPEMDEENFVQKLKQIQSQIHEAQVPGYSKMRLSVSVGGVLTRDETIGEAAMRADQLMYLAKQRKNMVVTEKDQILGCQDDVVRQENRREKQRILIVDDVISTGGSLHALETLAAKSTGTVVGCCAALAEGDAAKRTDIFFLEPLPLFLH